MGTAYRVFLVEDSAAIRETLAGALEPEGLVKIVGFAETADDAWRALQAQPVEAVVIDLQLRAGTGFDLLARLRRKRRGPRLLTVVLTNFSTDTSRRRCLSLGADYFFDKSVEFESAINLLDEAARQASTSEETN